MYKDIYALNDLLSDKIKNNIPFSVVRYDNTLSYMIHSVYKREPISTEFFNPTLLFYGGIVPNTVEYYFNNIFPINVECGQNCDFLAFCDISTLIRQDTNFVSNCFPNPVKFIVDHNYGILDPGLLVGDVLEQRIINPWTSLLKGKKVLVLSTHSDTILHQWNNMDLIWGDKREIIAPFDLVGCIRAPYHPELDDRQKINNENWIETQKSIQQEIDSYDYDILLCGSTNSAIHANYAKSKGKIGIQIGGVLQIYFGIRGYRWFANECNKKWADMSNEYWIYPLKSDYPNKADELGYKNNEIGYAYW